ncbi:uncharacterized protein [Triticum aestivum]|uniref:uncharacterized protein n=1 Tax=Triticum aestivum TaxID=4565 RepID=UPI001D0301E5|nr:uncharacterized protein LOC123076758 [Triticum aestivum]
MRKGPSPSSSSLPCAVPILLVIVCCCSLLLPCSCSAASDQGNGLFAKKGAGYSFPAGGRVPVQWPTPPQPGPPIRQGGGSSGSGRSGGGGLVYAQPPPLALARPHREDPHPRPRCKNLHGRRN